MSGFAFLFACRKHFTSMTASFH